MSPLISKRLRELREENHLLQKDVAKYLNITTSAYGYYEQGKRNPDIETVNKLADFFNVSTDYLLGRTNKKINSSVDLNNEEIKYETFSKIEEFFTKKLISEGIIKENEPIPNNAIEKSFKYGMDAAIEVLKLEKKLDNMDFKEDKNKINKETDKL